MCARCGCGGKRPRANCGRSRRCEPDPDALEDALDVALDALAVLGDGDVVRGIDGETCITYDNEDIAQICWNVPCVIITYRDGHVTRTRACPPP